MTVLPLVPLSDHLAPVRRDYARITFVLTPRFLLTRPEGPDGLAMCSLTLRFDI